MGLRTVRLCSRCEDAHMRPEPVDKDSQCIHVGCECWCKLGYLEVER